jgi:large subunit ribosomal protein L17
MRHGNFGRNFGRTSSHRKMLGRMLATAFFTHGRIRTTVPKAKELSIMADNLITLAKRGDLHARRQVASVILDELVTKRLFDTIAGWCKDRQGGYTRILLLDRRPGDNAPMCYIELVDLKGPLGPVKVVVAPKKKFKNKGPKKEKEKAAAKPEAKAKVAKAKKPAAPKAEKKAVAPKKKAPAKKKEDKKA